MNAQLYFDNAASSWPKPPMVVDAMSRCILEYAANPGRGSHRMAVQASRILFETRKHAAKLFGIKNPNDISFALNTTHALNQAIKGFVREGDHVICTSIEHNSVRRPLEYLREARHVQVTYIRNDERGYMDLKELEQAIRPNTSLVVVNHSSNLMGTIMPVGEIGELCRSKGVRLLVDAAQSAGVLPVDVESMNIDLLAFPGHKGLLGPQGTGGLYIHPDIEFEPLMHGGTGSQSEAIQQPKVRPDRYEAGTQNTPGLAGLNEGIKFVLNETVARIHEKEWRLTQRMMEGLLGISGVRVLGPELGQDKTGIVAFTLQQAEASEVAFILDQSFGIAVRAGYHCTPLAHAAAGTLGAGAVRASLGYFTTDDEVEQFIAAIQEISAQLG
ncbi:aminotransferase class V-fold PLP-dependent enzyme [Paenibacillus athensensis]|uniref:cysteine desulfurase n=1 Tax=Paenibacillus athensensis TaxID=1967502 RepID=A0A4Y8PWA9_9BACL|nr:aminotransferase class V-fold PLP-dependent enzyme [Paenibacillus athensensis]MCD1261806.1 aminotransferase class V-fold PLP-dependent enzyme [Paenibacillus athensensis]